MSYAVTHHAQVGTRELLPDAGDQVPEEAAGRTPSGPPIPSFLGCLFGGLALRFSRIPQEVRPEAH